MDVKNRKHRVLLDAIRARDWRIKDAAEFVGVTPRIMSQMINYHDFRRLTLEEEVRLAELTGKPFSELFPIKFAEQEAEDRRKETEAFAGYDPSFLSRSGINCNQDSVGMKVEEMLIRVEECLKQLSERQLMVFNARFLDGLTLAETGELLNTSGEGVRQIELRIVKKIRLFRIENGT